MYSRIGLEMHPVLVNGAIGFVATRTGAVLLGVFTIRGGRIVEMDILADRAPRGSMTVLRS